MRRIALSSVLRDSNEEETKEEGQGYRHDRSTDCADQRRLRRSRDRTELIKNTTRGQLVLKGLEKRRRAPSLNSDEDSESGNGDTRSECSPGTSQSTASKRPRRNLVPDLNWKLKVSYWLFLHKDKLQDSKSGTESKRAKYNFRKPPYILSNSQPPSIAPNVSKRKLSDRTFLPVAIRNTRSEYSSGTSCSIASMMHPPSLRSKSRLHV